MTNVANDTATFVPEDQAARSRARDGIDTTMLVEAGAGSGKTTLMISRMVQLILNGVPVDRIAAVTFTRKAAAELRERFEVQLERTMDESRQSGDPHRSRLVEQARRDVDRGFVGTIHAFCGRLLREHALAVSLPPDFEEVEELEHESMRAQFWLSHVERLRLRDDEGLRALDEIGISPADLLPAFRMVEANPDVEFAIDIGELPDHAKVRKELEALLERSFNIRPEPPLPKGRDALQGTISRLHRQRRTVSWDDVCNFCGAVEGLNASNVHLTLDRWATDSAGKAVAKVLRDDWLAFVSGSLAAFLDRWREYRYPIVMRVLSDAAAECRRERRERGKLDFADLLMIAAELLRTRRDARESLGRRYRHLLVDEFQDTDPVQAEVCLLLASDPSEGNDWRTVRPRPGSLFVVGDPKQSIYRFRRADIETYEFVKQRLAASGEVHLLTHNFRSTKPIEEFVNARFSGVFRRSDPADTVPPHAGNGAASPDVHHAEDAPGSIAGATQAMFAPMHTSRPAGESDGVYRYVIDPGQPRPKKELTAAVDASVLASWIAMRIAGGRSARDFLVLTSARDELRRIAAELAARRIAVDVSGAKINMDLELRELIVVLQALSDPENPVAVVAALEGLFFGCNHEELFAARECGVRFTISGEPGDRCPEPVRGALLRLREWWMATHREPSAIVIDRILTETGLLAWTTGRELGDRRAGMLLQLVDTLRDGTIRGTSDGSMRGVIDRLEALLESEEREPSLRPGRDDAVRVLNVHRAKGLEAPVVVLAAPVTSWNHAPSLAIRRDAAAGGGARIGGMRIVRKQGRSETILAQPPGWDAMSAREERLEQEERERILYVACTRAGEELVVSCALPSGNGSRWAPLMPALDDLATNLDLAATAAPGREIMTRTAASMREEIARVDARRTLAAVPGYALARVTDLAKRELPVHEGQRGRVRTPSDSPGLAWGRAVHAMLDRMVRGDAGADLELMLRAVVDREWPLEAADVRDAHLHSLIALGERVRQSGLWARIAACSRRHTEWPVAHVEHDSAGVPLLIEGVVDLAAFDGTRWLVVDWKSDTVPDDEWFARLPSYKAQVERYAAMIAARTGAGAEGIVVRLDWLPAVDQARR